MNRFNLRHRIKTCAFSFSKLPIRGNSYIRKPSILQYVKWCSKSELRHEAKSAYLSFKWMWFVWVYVRGKHLYYTSICINMCSDIVELFPKKTFIQAHDLIVNNYSHDYWKPEALVYRAPLEKKKKNLPRNLSGFSEQLLLRLTAE